MRTLSLPAWLLLSSVLLLAAPPAARAQCPDPTPSDLTPCGPLYTLPQWSTYAEWDQPRYYETIQLADLDGDGQDELLGRGTAGLYVNRFDAESGQWLLLPQGPPSTATLAFTALSDAAGFDQPQYYETLATADFDGDGRPELYVRSAAGLQVYAWNVATNSFAPLGPTLAALSDANGYDQPQYYQTIQAGDVDGDGRAELLVRGPAGLLTFFWNPGANTFTQSDVVITQLSDASGFDQPQYYQTIFTARPVPGGNAHVVARGASGLQMYGWTGSGYHVVFGSGPFRDSEGNDAPPFYRTLRAADIDGDGIDELMGRHASYDGALVAYSTVSYSFVQLNEPFDLFSALTYSGVYETIRAGDVDGDGKDELFTLVNPTSFDPPGIYSFGWDASQSQFVLENVGGPELFAPDDPSYYKAFRSVRLAGRPGLGLVIRGSYGIRTWVFNPDAGPVSDTQVSFVRPQPYGYPPFTGTQAQAYDDLNEFLGIAIGEVRDLYAGANAPNTAVLASNMTTLEATCQNPPLTGSPPSYASCAPPAFSTASAADWTAVANEIIAELYYASAVTTYFADVNEVLEELFLDEDGEYPALGDDLQLNEAANQKTESSIAKYFSTVMNTLANYALKAVASSLPDSAEIGAVVEVTKWVLGAVTDANLGSSQGINDLEQTYEEMQSYVIEQQEKQQDALEAQRRWVMGDLGLLRAVGKQVVGDIFTIDRTSALSAGREGFATWTYQTLLPTIWSYYVVTGCKNSGTPGESTTAYRCSPPSQAPYVNGPTGTSFSAILDHQSHCWESCSSNIAGSFCTEYCDWTTPDATDVGLLFDAPSAACTYDPSTTGAWEYGCNLGVDPNDLFQNRNGWTFGEYNCQPGKCKAGTPPSGAAASGLATRVGADGGRLRIVANVATDGPVDLRRASVVVWRVLFDDEDDVELLGDGESYPLELAPQRRTRKLAKFVLPRPEPGKTSQGKRPKPDPRKRGRPDPRTQGTPSVSVQLQADKRLPDRTKGLAVTLEVRDLDTVLPNACREGRKARIWTEIQIRDGAGVRHDLTLVEEWSCQKTPGQGWTLQLASGANGRAGAGAKRRTHASPRGPAAADNDLAAHWRRPARSGIHPKPRR